MRGFGKAEGDAVEFSALAICGWVQVVKHFQQLRKRFKSIGTRVSVAELLSRYDLNGFYPYHAQAADGMDAVGLDLSSPPIAQSSCLGSIADRFEKFFLHQEHVNVH